MQNHVFCVFFGIDPNRGTVIPEQSPGWDRLNYEIQNRVWMKDNRSKTAFPSEWISLQDRQWHPLMLTVLPG